VTGTVESEEPHFVERTFALTGPEVDLKAVVQKREAEKQG
jgi:hypothetical protein